MKANCYRTAARSNALKRCSYPAIVLILKVSLVCLVSVSAFAAGGACPAGLPVTGNNCYFIAANGADTNNGTSESTPWLHAPGMPNCTGACASVTPAAGNGFIFRGGDTWHMGNSALGPYTGGMWTFQWNGAANNPIYIGVDQRWFAGAAWARPILNGDNPLSTSTTLPGCTYNVGANNSFLVLDGLSHITVDNLEFMGMCSHSDSNGNVMVSYSYGSDMLFENLYFHGWTHQQFNCGTQCFAIFAFRGGSPSAPAETIHNVVIDGADSDPAGAGAFYAAAWVVYDSVFRNVAQTIVRLPHVWHDNLVEYWYAPGDHAAHGNVWESTGDAPGTNAFYNNIFRHLSPDGAGQVGIWPLPPVGTTGYWFNNLVYDTHGGISGNYFNVGQNGNSGNQGTLVIFNNTFEQNVSGAIIQCNSTYSHPFTAANNHYIDDASSPYSSPCTGGTFATELLMNHSTATSQGYTASETYAYSPTSSTNSTVGEGTNETSSFCSVLSNSSDTLLQAAGTACQYDTGYACSYNSGNHTVTCPARTATARPASGPWDAGAYEFSAIDPPGPPSDLVATPQ